jgi:hypothetical protein
MKINFASFAAALLFLSLASIDIPAIAGVGIACHSCLDWTCQDSAVIRSLQKVLATNAEKVQVDGSFGKRTEEALINYARRNNLSDTRPRSVPLLKSLFPGDQYESLRKQVFSAWVC